MSSSTQRPTVAAVFADLNELHEQVKQNQTTLETKITQVDHDLRSHLDQVLHKEREKTEAIRIEMSELRHNTEMAFRVNLDQAVHKEHEKAEAIRTEMNELRHHTEQQNTELSLRVDKIGQVINQSSAEIRETVAALQDSIDGKLKQGTERSTLGPEPVTLGFSWSQFKVNPKYRWLRGACWILVGLLVYHYLLVPFLTHTVAPTFLPNLIRPAVDTSTPAGIASVEVSREPFRSDSVSRAEFGRIFTRLDELVRTGQLADFEGYYNEFRREMEGSLGERKYDDWSGVWNRIAVVCHRYGNRPNDLKQFNTNLQTAARIVAGTASSHYGLPGGNLSYYPGESNSYTPTAPTPEGHTSGQWPHFQNFSPLTDR